MLKLILKKYIMRLWAGYIWLKTRRSGGLLNILQRIFRFYKRRKCID
jgi:hypothetical protein